MDLEDHLYRLRDQHLHLKKEAHEAKNQVKLLNTRVARLVSDKKARLKGQRTAREIELEELIFDMNSRVFELERENFRLKEKSLLLRSQLVSSHPHRRDTSSAYAHVAARVDSGLRRRSRSASNSLNRHKSFSTTSLHREAADPSWTARPVTARGAQIKLKPKDQSLKLHDPIYFHLLIEARDEIKNLEQIITAQERNLRETLQTRDTNGTDAMSQDDRDGKRNQNAKRHHEPEAERRMSFLSPQITNTLSAMAIKEQEGHRASDSRLPVRTNLKPYRVLNNELHEDKANDKVMAFVDSLKEELKKEKDKNSQMEKQIVSWKMSTRTLEEYKQRVHELQEENQILQDSLRKCVGSCFSEMKGSGNRIKEGSLEAKRLEIVETLQKQVHRLQDKLRLLESEKSSLQKQLLAEQETVFRLDEENAKLSAKLEELVIGDDHSRNQASEAEVKCRRADHTSMENELTQMQKERTEVLKEFSEMRQMLETIQSNIHKENEQEVYEDDFEETTVSDRVQS